MSPSQIIAILWARRSLIGITLGATLAMAILVLLLVPSRYDATATVMLESGAPDPVTGDVASATVLKNQQRSEIALALSNRVALDVVRRLNLTNAPAWRSVVPGRADTPAKVEQAIADELLSHLDASFVLQAGNETNVMAITYKGRDPDVAASLANAFVEAFVENSLRLKTEPAQLDAQWFATQNGGLRKELDAARNKLTEFQQQAGIVQRTEETDADTSRLHSLSDQIVQVKAALAAAAGALDQVRAVWPDGAPPPPRAKMPQALDNDSIARLKTSLADVEADIARASGDVGEKNPRLQSLRAAAGSIGGQLNQEYVAARASLASRVASLQDQLTSAQAAYQDQAARMLQGQAKRDELDGLSKDVALKQAQFDAAMNRAAALRLQGSLALVNVVPVDAAVPPSVRAFPKASVALALAIILGTMLGVLLALLREIGDRRIRSSSDLELAVGGPLLGVLLQSAAPSAPARPWWSGLLPARG